MENVQNSYCKRLKRKRIMIKHLLTLIWNRKKRSVLLIIELSLAFLILFSVFGFVLYNMDNYKTPLGFDTENIWMASLRMNSDPDSAERVETKALLLQSLRQIPEISEVSYSNPVSPFSGSTWQTSTIDNGFEMDVELAAADLNNDKTLGLNVVEGRWFNKEDKSAKYRPIVINKKMRMAYWPDSTAIGRIIKLNGESKIVGVIDNYKYHGEFSEEKNVVISLFAEHSDQNPTLIIRLKDGFDPTIEQDINRIIQQTTKGWKFSIENLESKRKFLNVDYWIPMVVLGSISGFLIFNVALGLFGVLVYNIKKRRGEIGLRRALGANPKSISNQFIFEILFLTSISILIALFFAIQFPIMGFFDVDTSLYIRAMFYSALVIYSLVLICTIYPSIQAARVHPATALHEE